ncbi:MAG: C4-dicarboxylate ABC transporter permease [Rhodoferax ferrireducens]|uniref:TRAP transporter small permease protein n=1 Tax=Rhodoferax ferrireducens TaxID=192843 RepID=A0A1W9KSI3_9BURK|nr:MAG: C4-dicarboxylate ABC transporter permease [Rhodoferax ferrireducens]
MQWLTWLNSRLSRWALYLAVACLMGIVGVVFGSVIWRYVLNDAPAWSEQVALILVINVAMFGAAAGVRDEGHIGMESLTSLLPPRMQFWVGNVVGVVTIVFGGFLCWGCWTMAMSVWPNLIPTLDISEAWRYLPCVVAGAMIILFSIEHLIAMSTHKKVTPSWH